MNQKNLSNKFEQNCILKTGFFQQENYLLLINQHQLIFRNSKNPAVYIEINFEKIKNVIISENSNLELEIEIFTAEESYFALLKRQNSASLLKLLRNLLGKKFIYQ